MKPRSVHPSAKGRQYRYQNPGNKLFNPVGSNILEDRHGKNRQGEGKNLKRRYQTVIHKQKPWSIYTTVLHTSIEKYNLAQIPPLCLNRHGNDRQVKIIHYFNNVKSSNTHTKPRN